jgi:hypothetical protein
MAPVDNNQQGNHLPYAVIPRTLIPTGFTIPYGPANRLLSLVPLRVEQSRPVRAYFHLRLTLS